MHNIGRGVIISPVHNIGKGMITSKSSPKYYKFSPKFLADPFENVISFCMFKWV